MKLKVKNELEIGWSGVSKESSSKAIFTTWVPTFSWNAIDVSAVLCSSSLEKEKAPGCRIFMNGLEQHLTPKIPKQGPAEQEPDWQIPWHLRQRGEKCRLVMLLCFK